MFHTRVKRLITTGLFITAGLQAFAQAPSSRANRENSPYSAYGIGELRNGANTLLKGMGTVSSAYANPYAVNSDNPASYSYIKLTTYEAGGEGSMKTVYTGNDRYQTGMATLSHMNIGIPGGKYLGLNFGLKPFSRQYFWMDDTSDIAGYGNSVKSYRTDGTLSYGYIGAAGKYKGLSVGFNFGYLFGTTESLSYLLTVDNASNVYNSLFSRTTKIGGVYWKGGALYEISLPKEKKIRLGATAALAQQLNASKEEIWISYSNKTGYADTSLFNPKTNGKIDLPGTYTAGIQFVDGEKWLAAVDFSTTQWGDFRSYGNADSLNASTYKVSVGGEYTPNAAALRNYFQRVTYRLGFYYGLDPVRLNNTDINVYAVTAGVSLPFKRTTDRIHMALETGSRGTRANGLIRENFVRFSVGMSLNDKWFVKRKYD